MKNLLTCSVCDQMLHEPWTIACGHTYCYSCLSSWFTQTEHKKTCPECRSTVTDMPAPAFVIKQIVDIYVNRLIQEASDPTQENHEERSKEERRAVEDDRAVDRLFKGCFNSSRLTRIVYDQSDRVYRCASCGHEFEGGAHCTNCGVSYEGENEAIEEDYMGSGLDEAEFGMDADDFEDGENFEHDPEDFDGSGAYFAANGMAAVGFPPEFARLHAIHHLRHYNHGRNDFQQFDSENDDDDDDDDEQGEDSDSSMRDFIEEVEPSEHESIESPRGLRRRARLQISDDEDEDDSSIVATQSRGARQRGERGNRSRPQIIDSDDEVDSDGNLVVDTTSGEERARYNSRRQTTTVQDSDDESSDFEHEDSFLGLQARGDESVEGGWSPLDGGGSESSDTNAGAFQDYQEDAHGSQYAEYQSDTDSDATPTLHTTNVSEDDGEGDEDEEGGASASRLMAAPDPPSRRPRPWEGPDDFNRPGQEEMYEFARQRRASASSIQQPQRARKRQSRRPRVISSDEEEDDEDQNVDDAMESSPEVNGTRSGRRDGENLGQVNYVHGDDEQSSEESVQPPRRRRRLFRFEDDEQIVTPRRLRMTTSGDSSGATIARHLANPWDNRGQLTRDFASPSPRSHRRLYYAPRDTISGGYARREQTLSSRPSYTVDAMGAITSPVLFRTSPRRRANYY